MASASLIALLKVLQPFMPLVARRFSRRRFSRGPNGRSAKHCSDASRHTSKRWRDRLPDPLNKKIGPAEAWGLLREYVKEHRSEFIDLRRGLRDDDSKEERLDDDYLVYVHQPKRDDLEYLFSDRGLHMICGWGDAWDKLKPRLKSEGWLVTNEERFVVKRQIFKKRENGEDNRSSVIAIRAAAFENEASSSDARPATPSTQAEAAARPAHATAKTTAPSPPPTRHSRPVKNNVNLPTPVTSKKRSSADVERVRPRGQRRECTRLFLRRSESPQKDTLSSDSKWNTPTEFASVGGRKRPDRHLADRVSRTGTLRGSQGKKTADGCSGP